MDLLLFNKPYRVLSQFTDHNEGSSSKDERRQTLADFIQQPAFYPAGRLDFHSEGLMILTDNGSLQHRITDPALKMEKSDWVQVERYPSEETLKKLIQGVVLKDGPTKPAKITRLDRPPALWPRNPPLALHREKNSQWLNITIKEGRNRQIRRMLASVEHPVLRLVRHRIGEWQLADLKPGQHTKIAINVPRNFSKKR